MTSETIISVAAKPVTRVMVDLETLGTTPGSVIVSIGAVIFDDSKILEEFYCRVDWASCIQAGLTFDADTVKWWFQQSEEARIEICKPGTDLADVLDNFSEWLLFNEKTYTASTSDAVELWGNGANFDNSLLGAAYRACGITPPWKFWNDRCYRTVKALYKHIPLPERTGTHHNALDDAKTQANHLIHIFAAQKAERENCLIAEAELATLKGELERMKAGLPPVAYDDPSQQKMKFVEEPSYPDFISLEEVNLKGSSIVPTGYKFDRHARGYASPQLFNRIQDLGYPGVLKPENFVTLNPT